MTTSKLEASVLVVIQGGDQYTGKRAPSKSFNFKRKRNQFGQKSQKASSTWLTYKTATGNNPVLEDKMSVVLSTGPVPTKQSKKNRLDDTWRSNRALQTKEKQMEKAKKRHKSESQNSPKRIGLTIHGDPAEHLRQRRSKWRRLKRDINQNLSMLPAG